MGIGRRAPEALRGQWLDRLKIVVGNLGKIYVMMLGRDFGDVEEQL